MARIFGKCEECVRIRRELAEGESDTIEHDAVATGAAKKNVVVEELAQAGVVLEDNFVSHVSFCAVECVLLLLLGGAALDDLDRWVHCQSCLQTW